MQFIMGLLRLLIPGIVLFMMGYLVAGFSALTIPWLLLLSILIFLGNWLFREVIAARSGWFGRGVMEFLVAAVVIFTATLAIKGGHVPLGGALLAAVIIAVLDSLLLSENGKDRIELKRT